MIKVAICDDDIATTGKIEDMLCRIAKRNFIPIETEVFWEGEHLSEAVESMDNSLRKESKVVQTKKQYGDFSLTALSFASISIFSG